MGRVLRSVLVGMCAAAPALASDIAANSTPATVDAAVPTRYHGSWEGKEFQHHGEELASVCSKVNVNIDASSINFSGRHQDCVDYQQPKSLSVRLVETKDAADGKGVVHNIHTHSSGSSESVCVSARMGENDVMQYAVNWENPSECQDVTKEAVAAPVLMGHVKPITTASGASVKSPENPDDHDTSLHASGKSGSQPEAHKDDKKEMKESDWALYAGSGFIVAVYAVGFVVGVGFTVSTLYVVYKKKKQISALRRQMTTEMGVIGAGVGESPMILGLPSSSESRFVDVELNGTPPSSLRAGEVPV
eukprot:GFYU01007382.1.p1 GENE.GFYU01007382.1~~GFYU01007382.1.p1  ORF type:complete len:305 (-),score=72.36 GFYU01007382.1:515-1429(-)